MSLPTRAEAAAYKSAGHTTLAGLMRRAALRIEDVAAAFWNLETKPVEPGGTGDPRAPIVHIGDLPPKVGNDDIRPPFIVVRLAGHTDTEQGADEMATATLSLEICTYSDTADGAIDLVNVIDAIRVSLLEQPVLEDSAYECVGPITSDIPEQQPRPQWLGLVTTTWRLPRPQRVESLNPTEE